MSDLISSQDFLNSKIWCYVVIESVFRNLDTDKKGFITNEDRKAVCDKVIEHYRSRSSPEAITAFKESSDRQSVQLEGKDKYNELDFLAKMADLAAEDMKRMFLEGKDPLLAKTSMVFFDVMDTDSDGVITKEEFTEGYKLTNWTDEAIEAAYKGLDSEDVGKITRKKMEEVTYEFWYKTNYESN